MYTLWRYWFLVCYKLIGIGSPAQGCFNMFRVGQQRFPNPVCFRTSSFITHSRLSEQPASCLDLVNKGFPSRVLQDFILHHSFKLVFLIFNLNLGYDMMLLNSALCAIDFDSLQYANTLAIMDLLIVVLLGMSFEFTTFGVTLLLTLYWYC